MWETICNAWACWSGWKFGANSTEYPYSVIQNTPPPRKLKFRQILGLWVFSVTEYPPPPPENWNLGRSWDFEYFQLQNTPPQLKFRQILALWVFSVTKYPPPQIEISGDLGTLSIFSYRIPPPPPKKLKFRQILALWLFSVTEYPPPPPPHLTNGKLCVVSYHMWRLYPTRITTRSSIEEGWCRSVAPKPGRGES